MLFTTNLTFAEWFRLLWNAKMTAALFDRLNLYSYIVETGNDVLPVYAQYEEG